MQHTALKRAAARRKCRSSNSYFRDAEKTVRMLRSLIVTRYVTQYGNNRPVMVTDQMIRGVRAALKRERCGIASNIWGEMPEWTPARLPQYSALRRGAAVRRARRQGSSYRYATRKIRRIDTAISAGDLTLWTPRERTLKDAYLMRAYYAERRRWAVRAFDI